MGTVTLLLGIHNHQPQGNFEHVFAQGYADCYRLLLQAIERHPAIRLTLHYSGPLIEWIEANHPEYFDTLASLVQRGQIEMMGGGFYEPMLSVLPEQDARGQLNMMADFLEQRVGKRPMGMWLAERVWEPDLARTIAGSGYRYTIVDDGHFLAAGMKRPLRGYYVTDKAGLPLCLFPISMELRYNIPFKPAPDAVDQLLRMADAAGNTDVVVTYGDDGEKFGMWPGTKKWVWDEGWLEQFFSLLENNAAQIRTATFSEILQQHSPVGRVYLPTASYDEMGEWSLPAEAQTRFHQLNHAVEGQQRKEDWGPFVRGGIWQGFLAKYPESNFMHKRMCYVSQRIAQARSLLSEQADSTQHKILFDATRELYRGQCNCAYWHGLFGGLYLAKLRSAVHSHLIKADQEISKLLKSSEAVEIKHIDLDADLAEEVIISNAHLNLIAAPARGGALLAIDDRQRGFCITDILTRRPEAYHVKVLELSGQTVNDQDNAVPKSIHDIACLKEEGLADILIYDPHQRLAFVDHFYPAQMDIKDLSHSRAPELGDFVNASFDVLSKTKSNAHLSLQRMGSVQTPNGIVEIQFQKAFHLNENTLEVTYNISPSQPLHSIVFATELSLTLPSGPHPTGQYRLSLLNGNTEAYPITNTGMSTEVSEIELADPTNQMALKITFHPHAQIVRFPIETVSQSESGIERTYQGSVVTVLWHCEIEPGAHFTPGLKLAVQ